MIQTLILAALAVAVVELLVPHGDGGRVAAYVRMVGGLFLLVVLLGPLSEGIALLQGVAEGELYDRLPEAFWPEGEPTDYESVLRDSLTAAGEAAVADWVRGTLAADFGIPAEEAVVAVLCDASETTTGGAGGLTLREVRIGLTGASALRDPRSIEAAIRGALRCDCFVTVGSMAG